MPTTTYTTQPPPRPQTLRQVKAAHRKTTGTSRISEQELKRIQRRAELEERAARIRERERKKELNRKRREEKGRREREREAAARKAERERAGARLGSGDSRAIEGREGLGRWFGRTVATSEGHDEKAEGDADEEEEQESKDGRDQSETTTVEIGIYCNETDDDSTDEDENEHGSKEDKAIPKQQPTANTAPSRTPKTSPIRSQQQRARDNRTNVLSDRDPNIIVTTTPRPVALDFSTTKILDPFLDLLDDLLPSNSQVERELHSTPPPKAVVVRTIIDDDALIPPISTQDLELSTEDLAEIMGLH